MSELRASGNRERILQLIASGVDVVDPTTTWVNGTADLAPGVRIEPGCHLHDVKIGKGSTIGPNVILRNVEIGEACKLESCTIDGLAKDAKTTGTHRVRLGNRVRVGPYSTIREQSVLCDDVKIGTHAEIVRARLAEEVDVGHFAYLGDAEVGARTNIGAGTVTCNYDGKDKHQTEIGPDAFIGSGTMLVAPVTIGEGARTGAGAVVLARCNVPAGETWAGVPAKQINDATSGNGG